MAGLSYDAWRVTITDEVVKDLLLRGLGSELHSKKLASKAEAKWHRCRGHELHTLTFVALKISRCDSLSHVYDSHSHTNTHPGNRCLVLKPRYTLKARC